MAAWLGLTRALEDRTRGPGTLGMSDQQVPSAVLLVQDLSVVESHRQVPSAVLPDVTVPLGP